jgi:hypothetical protein
MKPLDRPGHPPGLTERALADAGRRSEGSGPVERVRRLPVTLPCVGCHHAPVCSIRPGLEALVFTAPEPPHEAIHITTGRITVACSHRTTARARGHKVDPEVIDRALALIDGGMGIRPAAKATSLHYATLSRYVRKRETG